MNEMRLAYSPLTNKAYTGRMSIDGSFKNKSDVTEDFHRCIVRHCTEEVEFVVDGMRFKATCERID